MVRDTLKILQHFAASVLILTLNNNKHIGSRFYSLFLRFIKKIHEYLHRYYVEQLSDHHRVSLLVLSEFK